MLNNLLLGADDFENKFIRTCPVGTSSCFASKGVFDKEMRRNRNIAADIGKYYFAKRVIINYRGTVYIFSDFTM